MSALPPIVARNLRVIAANGTLALVDLQITKWRFEFRRCRWRKEHGREFIELPCDCGDFWNHGDHRRFQEIALAAVRTLAQEQIGGSQ